jgi:hypothetical protein
MTTHDAQVVDAWLGQAWPGGLIAAGGCDAEGKPFFRALDEEAAAQIKEESWLTLNEAVAQLAAYDCGEGRTNWMFEAGILWIAHRPDGAWAGIITPRELPHSLLVSVKSRLAEFVSAAE